MAGTNAGSKANGSGTLIFPINPVDAQTFHVRLCYGFEAGSPGFVPAANSRLFVKPSPSESISPQLRGILVAGRYLYPLIIFSEKISGAAAAWIGMTGGARKIFTAVRQFRQPEGARENIRAG